MTLRGIWMVLLIVVVTFALTSCEQLGALQNNKTRITGTWQMFSGGFASDEVYEFDSRIIKKDGFSWGTYRFLKNSEIEIEIGNKAEIYQVEFVTEDEMVFFEMIDGKRRDRYVWKRTGTP